MHPFLHYALRYCSIYILCIKTTLSNKSLDYICVLNLVREIKSFSLCMHVASLQIVVHVFAKAKQRTHITSGPIGKTTTHAFCLQAHRTPTLPFSKLISIDSLTKYIEVIDSKLP